MQFSLILFLIILTTYSKAFPFEYSVIPPARKHHSKNLPKYRPIFIEKELGYVEVDPQLPNHQAYHVPLTTPVNSVFKPVVSILWEITKSYRKYVKILLFFYDKNEQQERSSKERFEAFETFYATTSPGYNHQDIMSKQDHQPQKISMQETSAIETLLRIKQMIEKFLNR